MTAPTIDRSHAWAEAERRAMNGVGDFLTAIWQPGDVREVRIPRYAGSRTASGYFDDPVALAEAVKPWDGRSNLYLTLNPVAPALLARAANRIRDSATSTTSDSDILERRFLPIDIDPVRPAGISATDGELEAAHAVARQVTTYLHDQGFGHPVAAMSGNGYWLLYRVDLPGDDDGLVSRLLHHLAERFDTADAKLDLTVSNPARIGPLVGTMKVKGDVLPDRPHRRSELVYVPPELLPMSADRLRELAPADKPIAGQRPRLNGHTDRMPEGWVKALLDGAGLAYRELPPDAKGRAWYGLAQCPWHLDDGTPWQCGVGEGLDGKAIGKCFHDRGIGKGWQDFKQALGLEPPKIRINGAAGAPLPSTGAGTHTSTRLARVVVNLADVTAERVDWLWPGRIALGKVAIIEGDPGLGKSTVTLDLAARVSRGLAMPDGAVGPGVPAGVVILSAEDGLADTIRPRLDAAGADVSRIVALTGILAPDQVDEYGHPPSLPVDISAIEATAIEAAAVLIIIDPLMAYLGSQVDSHRDQDVRRALAPLAAMAERVGAAVIVVRHLNKSAGASAVYRGGGSIGIIGAARTALLVGADPEDENRRILAVSKCNLAAIAPALAYTLVYDPAFGCARVEWHGATEHRASELLAAPATDEERDARGDAIQFLDTVLGDGPLGAAEVRALARKQGIADRTLDRAKKDAGVVSERVGFGPGSTVRWSIGRHRTPAPGGMERGDVWRPMEVEADYPRSAWDTGTNDDPGLPA